MRQPVELRELVQANLEQIKSQLLPSPKEKGN